MDDMNQMFMNTIYITGQDIRLNDFYGDRHYDSAKFISIKHKLDDMLHWKLSSVEYALRDNLLACSVASETIFGSSKKENV